MRGETNKALHRVIFFVIYFVNPASKIRDLAGRAFSRDQGIRPPRVLGGGASDHRLIQGGGRVEQKAAGEQTRPQRAVVLLPRPLGGRLCVLLAGDGRRRRRQLQAASHRLRTPLADEIDAARPELACVAEVDAHHAAALAVGHRIRRMRCHTQQQHTCGTTQKIQKYQSIKHIFAGV